MKYSNDSFQPLFNKISPIIKHEKIYKAIHRQLMTKWFQTSVLLCIVGSITAIIYSSFEESAPYRNYLYSFNYFASLVYTIEYVLRLIAAPLQYPDSKYWKARLRYVFSFYGIIDFVAILPFVLIYLYKDSPSMHMIVLAYILIIFKLIRYSRSFRMIG